MCGKDKPYTWANRIHKHSKDNEVKEQVELARKSKAGKIDSIVKKAKPDKFPKIPLK